MRKQLTSASSLLAGASRGQFRGRGAVAAVTARRLTGEHVMCRQFVSGTGTCMVLE